MMSEPIFYCNKTAELSDCKDAWFFDEKYDCWCLEDVLYTQVPTTPKFQRLSIFVPKPYMSAPGVIDPQGQRNGWTAATAPVVLSNNSAGYMQMPHLWLDNPQCNGPEFLEKGHVFVTCGNRGRDSKDQSGNPCGKSPMNLIDLKMVVRFLRHNRESIPGDLEKIVSFGTSAGGAMSALLSVTGNSSLYDPYLQEAGAFMDERDDVFAGQMYCPITNLEHADEAYEWVFQADKENEASPAGPAGVMGAFEEALSRTLSASFIRYFNDLQLPNPKGGAPLVIGEDGRSGSGYDFLMNHLNLSASKWLTKLGRGQLPETYSIQDYLSGRYTRKVMAPMGGPGEEGKANLMQGHAGTKVGLDNTPPVGPDGPLSLGDMMSRPPKGAPARPMMAPPMVDAPGTDKRSWLTWKAGRAAITDLDTYILSHRRRMKPCPAFDQPHLTSGENEVMGTSQVKACHFSEANFRAICLLKDQFPGEYEALSAAWANDLVDQELQKRAYLYNPMNFIGTQETCDQAKFYRIRVGSSDADASFMISAILALSLQKAGKPVDYELVWEQPHGDADYPGEFVDWIEKICR
jgi:hypothetical protein